MAINFSFFRRKQEAKITLEVMVCPAVIHGERELKISVELTGKQKVQLGPYRLADTENIYEAVGMVKRYLSEIKFKGNIVIYSKTASETVSELFLDDLKAMYPYSKIEISGALAGGMI